MIEIKHLRLIQALAEHGSLTAAARVLGYSQPAVTQQLQRLEATVRTPLLSRSRNGIHLTPAGEVLLRHASSVLSELALAASEIEAVAGLRAGRIRVASFPSAAATVIPLAFAQMSRQHPGVSFTLLEALPGRALKLLRNGECDLALIYDYSPDGAHNRLKVEDAPDEVTVTLLEEEVYVAVPRDHWARSRSRIRLADFRNERWIAGCPSCRGNLIDACAASGFSPTIAFETDDYVALQRLVSSGLGIALVPNLMLAAAHPDASLVLRRISPTPRRTISVVSSRSLLKVPGVQNTVDALRCISSELSFPTVV